ncbi:MAG: histone deacetylase [Limnochordia bacterium]|nr:histone deacetylase [Bacillota bacterium]HOB08719.1 histone deacetylase [Limnochordia bacterium]NLH31676.1 histone deacetylase [Bacillota bacterium]HPT93266.1 histone deacetylase [Limnochordia bacterium]HPZ30816.1 histone deacetylase [Limnochordia bacterium]
MAKAKRSVGLIFFPAFDWCITPDHPEREERLLYTRDQIMEEGLLDIAGIYEYRPYVAEDKPIQRVHICVPSVARRVSEPHRIAVGGSMLAADLVLDNKVDCAFALLRPPGHHANRVVHGARGFCTVNNEAIMVEHMRRRLGPSIRVAIVDTDAHHADGTQDIFYNDPGILHISLHQDGRTLYPGTGFVTERGGPAAYGNTINVPLPPGTGDEGILYVMENLVMPILEEWKPDYIINAAGQDNHYSDPLTNMNFSAGGYARLTEMLRPDIVVLEGGYSIEGALPYVNVGIILALAGLDCSSLREPDWKPDCLRQPQHVMPIVKNVVSEVRRQWETRHQVKREDVFGRGTNYVRDRSIFYDTDQIVEKQHERIKLCNDCSGWREIYSQAAGGRIGHTQVAIVTVPWLACRNCRREAVEAYERLQTLGRFDQVFYQDCERDEYLCAPDHHEPGAL